jgi:hypothetical protein
MELKWIATAALAVALIPCAASAQSKTNADTNKASQAVKHDTVTTTSTGEVSAPGSEVTAAMLKAQQDPNLIGSPAWWKTHATADGKPLNSKAKPSD